MRLCALDYDESTSTVTVTSSRSLRPHNTPVVTLAIDGTETLLATGAADGTVKIWDIEGGYTTHTFHGSGSVVTSICFFEAHNKAKNGKPSVEHRLAAGYEDGQIRIWSLEKRKSIAVLESHVTVVRALDFDSKSNLLLSASRDKTLVLWSPSDWTAKKTLPTFEEVEAAAFLSSTHILTGGQSGRLRMWNASNGKEVRLEEDSDSEIAQAIIRPDASIVLSVHIDLTLQLHRVQTPHTGPDPKISPLKRISGTHDEVIDFGLVGRSKDHLAVATNVEDIKILSARTSEGSYFGADVGLLRGHEDIVISLDVDWSGSWVLSGAKDNTARLWRVDPEHQSYTCVAVMTGHAESIGAVALPSTLPSNESAVDQQTIPDPPRFALTGSQDKTVKHWSITPDATGKQCSARANYTRKAHEKDINAIDINSDSTLFASASQDRTVKIWSIEDGEAIGVLRGHRRGVWSVKFAPKGVPAISSGGSQTSSSRGYALTGSGDKTVKIWNLSDYSCLRTFEGHTNSVLKVEWISTKPPELDRPPEEDDGSEEPHRLESNTAKRSLKVASAAGDGLVKVWDVASEDLATTLDNHTDRVWALIVHPTNSAIISGGGDGVITLWKDTTSSRVAASAAASTARIEEDQKLQNFMRNGSYREAITLALQLNHPARLLALFSAVTSKYPPETGSICGVKAVDEVIANLSDDQLLALLGRLRDWNSNAKTAPVAQRVLHTILKSYSPAKLLGLGTSRSNIKDILDGLKAYTERHYGRMEELIDESYLVDYFLQEMNQTADTTVAPLLSNGIHAT